MKSEMPLVTSLISSGTTFIEKQSSSSPMPTWKSDKYGSHRLRQGRKEYVVDTDAKQLYVKYYIQ
jgi:hypothetical protein